MGAQGYVVDTMVLTIDPDEGGAGAAIEIECAIQGITWNTADEEVTWRVACPDGYGADSVRGDQTLDVSYTLDYRNATTLARVLDENHGKTATVAWTPDPKNAADYLLGGTVVLQRGSRSHQVGALATATASWPVRGEGIKPIDVIVP